MRRLYCRVKSPGVITNYRIPLSAWKTDYPRICQLPDGQNRIRSASHVWRAQHICPKTRRRVCFLGLEHEYGRSSEEWGSPVSDDVHRLMTFCALSGHCLPCRKKRKISSTTCYMKLAEIVSAQLFTRLLSSNLRKTEVNIIANSFTKMAWDVTYLQDLNLEVPLMIYELGYSYDIHWLTYPYPTYKRNSIENKQMQCH